MLKKKGKKVTEEKKDDSLPASPKKTADPSEKEFKTGGKRVSKYCKQKEELMKKIEETKEKIKTNAEKRIEKDNQHKEKIRKLQQKCENLEEALSTSEKFDFGIIINMLLDFSTLILKLKENDHIKISFFERLTVLHSEVLGKLKNLPSIFIKPDILVRLQAIEKLLQMISSSKSEWKVLEVDNIKGQALINPHICLLYTSPSPRDLSTSRMPSSA
eukprot:TRINITY_DN17061_c0_g1_i3.p1 TRINITY_DN17061_c0_g1~~TRINITY_DN17061_c0_g1_i3.p1  ORF type:complete len:234 (-),score=60.87 TRINITY_DN17061_c0_g1_i3:52-699(-)